MTVKPISAKRKKRMQNWFWFVKPNGEFVRGSITEAIRGLNIVDVELASKNIYYKGSTIPGFMLGQNLAIPEWLAKNRLSLEGSDVYHSDFSSGPWEKWKGNTKTPAERNQGESVAKQMREKKKK